MSFPITLPTKAPRRIRIAPESKSLSGRHSVLAADKQMAKVNKVATSDTTVTPNIFFVLQQNTQDKKYNTIQ